MQVVLVIICITVSGIYLGIQVYQRLIKKDAKCDACAMGKENGSKFKKV
jgi:hypothetical protein